MNRVDESTLGKKRWLVTSPVIYGQENPGRAFLVGVPDASSWTGKSQPTSG